MSVFIIIINIFATNISAITVTDTPQVDLRIGPHLLAITSEAASNAGDNQLA